MVAAFDLVVCLGLMFLILALTSNTQPPHIKTFGKYAVTMTWPPKSNDDFDLYVRDPIGSISFFGNTSMPDMHLEHDDLGALLSNTTQLPNGRHVTTLFNGERTVITQVLPGEYTVNVHYYRRASNQPIPVTVELWSLQGNDRVLLTRKIIFRQEGQEVTVWRFNLSQNGSVSNVNERHADLVYNVKFKFQPTNTQPFRGPQ